MEAASVSFSLTPADPYPVDVLYEDSDAPVLLLCEHAGQAVPAALGDLGVSAHILDSHRGWDIGAADVARKLAENLSAPLVLQRYSRLVIDANRPPDTTESIPEISDGIAIPGNKGLTVEERNDRARNIFKPMNETIQRLFDANRRSAAFSIHSYTPRLGTRTRPWHAGFLNRANLQTAEQLRAVVAEAAPDMSLAINQPYQIEDETDWFIPAHAEPRNIPHCLIEIRNDQIDHPEGVALWAELLTNAIRNVMKGPQ